jgi:thioredoxin 1
MMLSEFNFKTEVLEAPGPVLVDFWAPWCGPCRMMEPVLEALARDYKVCKVNVDSNPKLATRYRVESIPLLVVFKDGREVGRHVGVTAEAALRRELEQLSGPAGQG